MGERKTIRFGSWNELKKAIPGCVKLGYECEVRGWDAMRDNKLTITDTMKSGEAPGVNNVQL